MCSARYFSCDYCGNTFVSEYALNQHTKAVHPPSCDDCDRIFRSQYALNQHTKAVHPPSCEYCDRIFESESALNQHIKDIHSLNPPPPPVSTSGYWMRRNKFPYEKSFGFFECICEHWWESAHSFKRYKQSCQACDKSSHPFLMWYSTSQKDASEDDSHSTISHDKSRCEACRLRMGICLQ